MDLYGSWWTLNKKSFKLIQPDEELTAEKSINWFQLEHLKLKGGEINLKNPLSWAFSTGARAWLVLRERPEALAERTGKIWAQVNVVLLRGSFRSRVNYNYIWRYLERTNSATRRILQRCMRWWRQSWQPGRWSSTEVWTKQILIKMSRNEKEAKPEIVVTWRSPFPQRGLQLQQQSRQGGGRRALLRGEETSFRLRSAWLHWGSSLEPFYRSFVCFCKQITGAGQMPHDLHA